MATRMTPATRCTLKLLAAHGPVGPGMRKRHRCHGCRARPRRRKQSRALGVAVGAIAFAEAEARLVPGAGLEPARPVSGPADFKSAVSTDFTIRAGTAHGRDCTVFAPAGPGLIACGVSCARGDVLSPDRSTGADRFHSPRNLQWPDRCSPNGKSFLS